MNWQYQDSMISEGSLGIHIYDVFSWDIYVPSFSVYGSDYMGGHTELKYW